MGIQVGYRRMSQQELDSLAADPQRAIATLCEPPGLNPELLAELAANPQALQERAAEVVAAMQNAQVDTTRVDLGKDWHAIHYLLTGDASMERSHDRDNPLHNVVMGGRPTAIEASYGPVRCLSQADISDIVSALADITVENLRDRFSADEFKARRIYPNPQPGGWTQEDVEGVLSLYLQLKAFFAAALEANEVAIVFAM